MNKCLLLVAATAAWLPWRAATAAVFERDWKTPGDGLLTYDDVNQREWLDLTESRLAKFSGSNLEERFQSALLELQPGGMFDGFIAAKEADLVSFADSAGINTNSFSLAENGAAADVIGLVGPSISHSTRGAVSFGLLDDVNVSPGVPGRLTGQVFVNPDSGPMGRAGVFAAPGFADGLATPSNTGVWLYRVVPEPSTPIPCALAFFVHVSLRWAGRGKISQLRTSRRAIGGSTKGTFYSMSP